MRVPACGAGRGWYTSVTMSSRRALVEACNPARAVLGRVGDTWSMLIVIALREGPLRFSELKRAVHGVSQRMLTRSLRSLERDGLVSRTVTPTRPPRVDYELTALGHSLREPVEALGRWATRHRLQLERAQQRYDRGATRSG